jgi:hypothetical protein
MRNGLTRCGMLGIRGRLIIASQPFFGFNLRIGSRGKKANPDTLILSSVSTTQRVHFNE